jgi:penicillin-binding protein 1C
MRNTFCKKYGIVLSLFVLLLILYWNILPDPLFDDPTSTAVYSSEHELLGARIADDGQWRFPQSDSLPYRFRECIIHFEDRYFTFHPGINPISLGRAMVQNIRAGEIISGGSTITMQVIRLSRKNRSRTVQEKLLEILMAIRLEIQYSKEDILKLYSTYAPFGGNVVGLETASWRYFGTSAVNLSWAETACLAVLPNAPSLIYPGKNRELLLQKRNRLLRKLHSRGVLDDMVFELALEEPLPGPPLPLPELSYHLTERLNLSRGGLSTVTTINENIQQRVNEILEVEKKKLYSNGIRNAACLIIEVESGNVLAYAGNIRNPSRPDFSGDVDIITSPRSSGSILKPLLYSEMQYRGDLLPQTIIPDIPTRYGNYSPKNYNRGYDGMVPAAGALVRSLNVPAVRMLHQYGIERFLHDLRSMGFATIDNSADHYGLSLILGGAECTLEELASVYSSMARVLRNYSESNGKYFRNDWRKIRLLDTESLAQAEEQGILGAGAIWLTFEALREVNRPESLEGWQFFSSSRKLAWKTGTSFGFRDGWAVGTTPDYLVAVWTGNADGEGRPGISGINTAAPLLFQLFNILPETSWFEAPLDDLVQEKTCRISGYKAGRYCMQTDSTWISPNGRNTSVCPFHKLIHLDKEKKHRVNSSCYPVSEIMHEPWFVLPPAQEWFYRQKNPSYKLLPPIAKNCIAIDDIPQIQIIYPDPGSIIYIPKELDGEKGRVILEAAHRDPEKKIFWSIDDLFVAETRFLHQISILPEKGKHILTLVDEDGNSMNVDFELIDR